MSSAWVLLIVAGVFETAWAIGLKYSQGFTKHVPSALTLASLVASMYLLARASQSIPIGTAYSVWVGIGAFGAAILGIFLFQEPVSFVRLAFLALLAVAIVGLKFTS